MSPDKGLVSLQFLGGGVLVGQDPLWKMPLSFLVKPSLIKLNKEILENRIKECFPENPAQWAALVTAIDQKSQLTALHKLQHSTTGSRNRRDNTCRPEQSEINTVSRKRINSQHEQCSDNLCSCSWSLCFS